MVIAVRATHRSILRLCAVVLYYHCALGKCASNRLRLQVKSERRKNTHKSKVTTISLSLCVGRSLERVICLFVVHALQGTIIERRDRDTYTQRGRKLPAQRDA